jgi:hypothetical protein
LTTLIAVACSRRITHPSLQGVSLRICLLSFFALALLVFTTVPSFADAGADPSCLAKATAQLDSKAPGDDRAALVCLLTIVNRQQTQIEALEEKMKHTTHFLGCFAEGVEVPCGSVQAKSPAQSKSPAPHVDPWTP